MKDRKIALFAFNGEPMCFVHVLLNALDMQARGWTVRVIIEGSATRTAAELADPDRPFAKLYAKVRNAGLIDCVCKACSAKMGVLEQLRDQGLSPGADMSGHPGVGAYIEKGFEVLTF